MIGQLVTAELSIVPEPGHTIPESIVMRSWPHVRVPFRMPEGIARSTSVVVAVNHGRWIVHCPFCPGAQLASEADHRFFCTDCLHVDGPREARGKWLEVRWPNMEILETATAVLAERPADANRNFDPRIESVEDLKDENAEQALANELVELARRGDPKDEVQVARQRKAQTEREKIRRRREARMAKRRA